MTTMPDKCPRCGADFSKHLTESHNDLHDGHAAFDCGSVLFSNGHVRETGYCLRRQNEALMGRLKRLLSSVGECHLMISRGTDEFQTKHDWEATDLPKRLQSVMRQNAALRELLQETQRRAKSVVDDLERHQQYCEPQYGKYGQLDCDACDALYELRDILEAVEVSDDA